MRTKLFYKTSRNLLDHRRELCIYKWNSVSISFRNTNWLDHSQDTSAKILVQFKNMKIWKSRVSFEKWTQHGSRIVWKHMTSYLQDFVQDFLEILSSICEGLLLWKIRKIHIKFYLCMKLTAARSLCNVSKMVDKYLKNSINLTKFL